MRLYDFAVVVKGYPRLSETFIAQELLSLQELGYRFVIISLRPGQKQHHDVHRQITQPVLYLPEYCHKQPWRVLKAWLKARRLPGYTSAKALFRQHRKRDNSRARWRRFFQACVVAAEAPQEIQFLYVHFLHSPADVTWYAAEMLGLDWGGSGHAKDIYTSPEADLRDKLAASQFVVTCTAYNQQTLQNLTDMPEKVHLMYHGATLPQVTAKQVTSDNCLHIVSICRAVPKKGLDVLLQALAALPRDISWRFSHVGGGDLLPALQEQATSLGIADRCQWLGAQPREAVFTTLSTADLFVLASRITENGDRDGLPNVLLEAMGHKVACIATSVSAIPELITEGETGLLVPSEDPQALSNAILTLAKDSALRLKLAEAGYNRVHTEHQHSKQMPVLEKRLNKALGRETNAA